MVMVLVQSKINFTFVKPDIFPDLERYSITVYNLAMATEIRKAHQN